MSIFFLKIKILNVMIKKQVIFFQKKYTNRLVIVTSSSSAPPFELVTWTPRHP